MRLLVVVAHPDDETFGCGSLLAHAAAAGVESTVLCATRGEAGESSIDTDDLGALREAELRAAAVILGVHEVRLLDHRDSGMTGAPAPGTLVAADPAVVQAEVAAVLDELRPEVVVTLDAMDGHRDHVVMRDATLAAIDAMDDPPTATYLRCFTVESRQRWVDHMRSIGGGEAYVDLEDLGTPDEDITLFLDTAAHLDLRWQAIKAHASQRSPYDDLPLELQLHFLERDPLQLVRGTDALFA